MASDAAKWFHQCPMLESLSANWWLVALFSAHWLAFALLSWRRRSLRYMPALVTFTLLIALNLCKALEVGSAGMHGTLRLLAFLGLAVSIFGMWWRRKQKKQSAEKSEGEAMQPKTKTYLLEQEQFIPKPRTEVFAFFSDAFNLEALTPPFLHFKILTPPPIEMAPGTIIDYQIRLFAVPMRWKTEIKRFEPETLFVDGRRVTTASASPS